MINFRRNKNNKIWGIDIFNIFIDLRIWYKYFDINSGEWFDIWYLEHEKFEEESLNWKKINFFEKNNFFWL